MIIAAVLLVVIWHLGWLNIWTLLICVIIPTFLNMWLVGQTHRKEIHIDDDPLP
jgi:hypothetical protein